MRLKIERVDVARGLVFLADGRVEKVKPRAAEVLAQMRGAVVRVRAPAAVRIQKETR